MQDSPSIRAHNAEPITAVNPPFQPRLTYRADDYSTLRYRMLDHLQELFPNWNPELIDNEGSQDLAVAFVELMAYVGDILGFYQDCRAREAFLRTAVLGSSLIDITALIDYHVPPGASASTLQAFLLKAGRTGKIPAGFQVKAASRNGEPALIFETEQDLSADVTRNQLHMAGYNRSTRKLNAPGLPPEQEGLLDQGYAGLKAGSFAVVAAPGKQYAVQLTAVTEEGDTRRVSWDADSISLGADLPIADLIIRGKPKQLMPLAAAERADELTLGSNSVRVGNEHHGLTPGAPIVFVSNGVLHAARVISVDGDRIVWDRSLNISLRRSQTRIHESEFVGEVQGTLRRGATRIELSGWKEVVAGDHVLIADDAGVERMLVRDRVHSYRHVASAGLTQVRYSTTTLHLATPLLRSFRPPVEFHKVTLPSGDVTNGISIRAVRIGDVETDHTRLELGRIYEGLASGDPVAVSDAHKQSVHTIARVEIVEGRTVLTVDTPVDEDFEVATMLVHGPFEHAMRIDGYNRSESSTVSGTTSLTLDGIVSGLKPGAWLVIEGGGHAEGLRITALAHQDGNTKVDFESPAVHSYPLADTVVYGNVAAVSHGAAVVERVVGSGDHSQADQQFTLHKHPTTYVHDGESRRGVSNTLEVFIDDERWEEVESLAGSGPQDRHYVTQIDEEQVMSIRFGDGTHGARLTTGRNNVRVQYRVGLGAGGNVAAGEINTMPQALPFIDSTRNPIAAAGGEDRKSTTHIRQLAPGTVRTLDRAVSLSDYAYLALDHAGLAKARADWDWQAGRRVIQVTVAATEGQPLTPPLKEAFRRYLNARRSPHHRLLIRDHQKWPVRLELEVNVLPEFLPMETRLRVERALGAGTTESGEPGYFHFDRRSLGEDLFLSDIYALVESVRGVDYVVAAAFHPEATPPAAGAPLDRVQVPINAIASGGHPTDPALGKLVVAVRGGIA